MNKKALQCLYGELPALVTAGVLSEEAAHRIRVHYGPLETESGIAKRWAVILFGLLGAILIGGGIILLLAHNWEELSRPQRAVLSVLPLIVAQALGAWVLFTQREGPSWREGIGAFQTLAIGTAIALVSQTYNLGGEFDQFMLLWCLLALPIAYLLRATFPVLFYLVGVTVWAGSVSHEEGIALWYFGLFALAVPFLAITGRSNRYHPVPVLVGWFMGITFCIGTGIALNRVSENWMAWPVLFATLFSLLYLTGERFWSEGSSFWQRPLQTLGSLGTVGLALLLSFRDSWPGRYNAWNSTQPWEESVGGALGILLFLSMLILWALALQKRELRSIILGAAPFVALTGMGVLFNAYLALLGIVTLAQGLRSHCLGVVNAGMAILSTLILCRFFDSEVGFLMRGVAFILIGIGFLATNLVLMRWKGETNS